MFSFVLYFDNKNHSLGKKLNKMTDILKRQKITNDGADVEKEMNIVVMYRYTLVIIGKNIEDFQNEN